MANNLVWSYIRGEISTLLKHTVMLLFTIKVEIAKVNKFTIDKVGIEFNSMLFGEIVNICIMTSFLGTFLTPCGVSKELPLWLSINDNVALQLCTVHLA